MRWPWDRQVMRVDPQQVPASLKQPAMDAGQPPSRGGYAAGGTDVSDLPAPPASMTARPSPLTASETLAMIGRMAALADETAEDEPWDEAYWEGWAESLRTLAQHIRTGVKVTCFPAGSCACHPWPGKDYVMTAKPRRRRKPQ